MYYLNSVNYHNLLTRLWTNKIEDGSTYIKSTATGDDGSMTNDQIEEFSQGDGGTSDDTTNDLAYKNGG